MVTLDDLLKNRNQIAKMLDIVTNGEIVDIDFIIDHLSTGRPIITIMVAVPGKVKKEYNMDMDLLLNKHEDSIRQVISSFGFPQMFSRTVRYMVL